MMFRAFGEPTQKGRFMDKEVGGISRFFVAPRHAFPLSVWRGFAHILFQKYLHLSTRIPPLPKAATWLLAWSRGNFPPSVPFVFFLARTNSCCISSSSSFFSQTYSALPGDAKTFQGESSFRLAPQDDEEESGPVLSVLCHRRQ